MKAKAISVKTKNIPILWFDMDILSLQAIIAKVNSLMRIAWTASNGRLKSSISKQSQQEINHSRAIAFISCLCDPMG
jgi:hypothetical protein